jgi:hypothetical protein
MIRRRVPGLRCGFDRKRRYFAVKPILLVSQGHPCLRHAQVTPEGRLTLGAFRELQAILSVIPEQIRLFHALHVGTERREDNEKLPDVNGNLFVMMLPIIAITIAAAEGPLPAAVTRQTVLPTSSAISYRSTERDNKRPVRASVGAVKDAGPRED